MHGLDVCHISSHLCLLVHILCKFTAFFVSLSLSLSLSSLFVVLCLFLSSFLQQSVYHILAIVFCLSFSPLPHLSLSLDKMELAQMASERSYKMADKTIATETL